MTDQHDYLKRADEMAKTRNERIDAALEEWWGSVQENLDEQIDFFAEDFYKTSAQREQQILDEMASQFPDLG